MKHITSPRDINILSIENTEYPNVKIISIDDCSAEIPFVLTNALHCSHNI
jgi:hypothetical protein